ncbi:hypothetical protein GCM10010488_33170 [Oerskovia jenensis]
MRGGRAAPSGVRAGGSSVIGTSGGWDGTVCGWACLRGRGPTASLTSGDGYADEWVRCWCGWGAADGRVARLRGAQELRTAVGVRRLRGRTVRARNGAGRLRGACRANVPRRVIRW